MRDTSSERLASETAEEREARLQRLTDRLDLRLPRRGRPGCESANQHERLVSETAEERTAMQAATDEC